MLEVFFSILHSIFMPLFTSSVFPILIILLLLSVLLKWRMPFIKGVFGEWLVKLKLGRLGKAYTSFHDVYIPNGERGLTQVDHIVTSPYGLFVIETKHYSGWIFGDEYKPYWTQVIYKKKTKLYNPIRQNYGHIQALTTYIEQVGMGEVHSIIAFSTESTFKFKNDFSTAHVIQFPELLKTIRTYNEPCLSEETVAAINAKLNRLLITDNKEKRRLKKMHLQSIRKRIGEKQQRRKSSVSLKNTYKQAASLTYTNCPQCNGQLVLRKGRYGSFHGCSNYPKCKYTENIKSKREG